jgi:hypothetical protein
MECTNALPLLNHFYRSKAAKGDQQHTASTLASRESMVIYEKCHIANNFTTTETTRTKRIDTVGILEYTILL